MSVYSVTKVYLDFLIETADNLELQNIFAHCDEAVYSKLLHIMWNSGDEFKKGTAFLDGFYQLMWSTSTTTETNQPPRKYWPDHIITCPKIKKTNKYQTLVSMSRDVML